MAPLSDSRDPRTWRTDVAHLEGLSVCALATDREGRIVHSNLAAENLLNCSRDQLLGQDLLGIVVPEENQGGGREIFAHALSGAAWSGLLPFRDPVVGEPRALDVSATPLRFDGTIVGVLFVLEDATDEEPVRARSQRLSSRLARVARVTAELVTAEDMAAVTKTVVSHAADAAGATVASLFELVDEDLVIVGIRGADEQMAARWETFPLAAHTPAGDAIRLRRPLVLSGREEIESKYPGLEMAASGERTLVVLPLLTGGRTLGAIGLSFPSRRVFDNAEQEFLRLLADTCAQAMDRIRALEDSAARAYKLKFLTDASAELSRSLDYEATLSKVAWLGVPEFADWCSVSLLEDGDLRPLAIAHVDPAKVALAEELQTRYPPDPDAPQGAWNVVRTGQSELIPLITDELLTAAAQDEEHLHIVRELNLRSAMSVPLVAHGKVLGVMSWVSANERRLFSPSDLAFAEDLAQRAAVAIDNAQLHSETREAAVRLQRAVLPEALPEVEGWQFASYYSPSGRTEVGGDFYDVLHADGTLALFVGDVMGRGVTAAAAMAQMRAAVRSYVALDPTPESVVRRLDTMFETYAYTQLVTLVYALADPERNELSIVNAGHPPPLVLHDDGSLETVSQQVTAPLGLGLQDRTPFTVPFGETDKLLLYTDGLIERRNEDIDVGQERLASACTTLDHGDLDKCLEQLVESVRDHTREDDVAALVAQRSPTR